MQATSERVKADMNRRLRRIEGQVQGLQRMLDDDRDCREIVQQLQAIRSAVQNATTLFMQSYARDCLLQTEELSPAERADLVDELLDLMARTA